MSNHDIHIMGLSASTNLTNEICKNLGIKENKALISRFADGEILVKSESAVRNCNITVIQSTSAPVNENLMELLIAIDSLKRASAASINVVIPYYGYARQDRKALGREPITSKMVASLLEKTGASRVTIIDIHSEQIQGFFDIPVDTLPVANILLSEVLKKYKKNNLVVVAPDYGAVKRARKIAENLHVGLAILDKRRPRPNVSEISNLLGDVRNKDCIVVDDIADTAGTIVAACKVLKENGAKSIVVMVTHGIFSGPAVERLTKAVNDKIISDIYVSNSIESVYKVNIPNLHVVSLAHYLSDVIEVYYCHNGGSISEIYRKYDKTFIKK